MFKRFSVTMILGGTLLVAGCATAQIRIAYIDPPSGPFPSIGGFGLKSFIAIADDIKAKSGVAGGHKLEIVAMDNKGSPEETLNQLKWAIDSGIRFVVQRQGSGAVAAMTNGINKWNERTPDKTVALTAARDNQMLTNCSMKRA